MKKVFKIGAYIFPFFLLLMLFFATGASPTSLRTVSYDPTTGQVYPTGLITYGSNVIGTISGNLVGLSDGLTNSGGFHLASTNDLAGATNINNLAANGVLTNGGGATLGTVSATSANLTNVYGLMHRGWVTNESGFALADTNDVANSTNTARLATNLGSTFDAFGAAQNATNTDRLAANLVGRYFFIVTGIRSPGFTSTPRYDSLTASVDAASAANAGAPFPACTATNLYVNFVSLGSGTNAVATLVTNGVASNLSVSLNGTGATILGQDTSHSVPIASGTLVCISFSGNNPSAYNQNASWSVQFY